MRFLFDFRRRQENGPPSPSAGCSRSAYGASRTGPTRSRKHMWLPNTILINFDNIRPDEVECNIDNTLIPNHDQPIINIDIHLRSDCNERRWNIDMYTKLRSQWFSQC